MGREMPHVHNNSNYLHEAEDAIKVDSVVAL